KKEEKDQKPNKKQETLENPKIYTKKKKPKRIHAFDIVRAIAIALMILAHSLNSWLNADSQWIEGIYYVILSPMGVPGFLFVSGMSFGFSWFSKEKKGFNYKENTIYQLSRTLAVLFVSTIYNLVAVLIHHSSILDIWFWFILQSLAVSRLLGGLAMKLGRIGRIVLAVVIIIITPILINILELTREGNSISQVVYWILFNPVEADSFMFFFPAFLVGSVIGQEIHQITKVEDKEEPLKNINKNPLNSLKILLLIGCLFVISGILGGLGAVGADNKWSWVIEFQTHPDWNITETPMFLVRNTYAWILYSIGIEIVLSIVVFYIIDYKIKREKRSEFELFGRYSFTIYISHYLCYLIPLELDHITTTIAFFIFMGVLWIMIHLIDIKSNGKYSLEFLMGIGANELYKLLKSSRASTSKSINNQKNADK
ncbi:MAG: DUF1624 domain-containing protein, partial [Candidatus Lokiarchaeota archaeon]|nr:DUF1624 domain-containing protein [Candidatus Lokiarchaeota archaeon]